jgi:hypothetical protein
MIRRAGAAKASENAAKWLADKGWEKSSIGRPSKEKINKEARKLQAIKDEVSKDSERLGINK